MSQDARMPSNAAPLPWLPLRLPPAAVRVATSRGYSESTPVASVLQTASSKRLVAQISANTDFRAPPSLVAA